MFNQEYEKRLLAPQNNSPKKSEVLQVHATDAVSDNPPITSPSRRRDMSPQSSSDLNSDRFIPNRTTKDWQIRFPLINHVVSRNKVSRGNEESGSDGLAYSCLLKNELLGTTVDDIIKDQCEIRQDLSAIERKLLFQYSSHKNNQSNCETRNNTSGLLLSPVSAASEKILRSPRKVPRKISRVPYKVLDAPELQDDFYLNLVDWSSQNILCVGLGSFVYLWSPRTGQVTKLCDLSLNGNSITSVAWNERGNFLAVGTRHAFIQVWDVTDNKLVNRIEGHTGRVGCLAWNGDLLCSGSRDRNILQYDIRTPEIVAERTLIGHRQEVCGLKWSPDNQYLASGGNDNRLYIWNLHSLTPVQTYTKHKAAIKALAWSPHQHGLLASGGGTADRCIRLWNTLTGQPTKCVDTGSQVCNLGWAKHTSELVSTHGYSQNQILVWRYPNLVQVAKLLGHTYRVLYLAMSPDGESIVTGAGDETLRFWNIFGKSPSQKENMSVLKPFTSIR